MAQSYYWFTCSHLALGEHGIAVDDGEIVEYDPEDDCIARCLPEWVRIAAQGYDYDEMQVLLQAIHDQVDNGQD